MIPASLGEGSEDFFSPASKEAVLGIRCFLVENERTARRFLRRMGYREDFGNVVMVKMETDDSFVAGADLLNHLLQGRHAGVISEAGAPGIADPGAAVVRWAYASGIRVIPLIGPSSILMALMASGMNGQQFCFHGYLPVKSIERRKKIRQLEEESAVKRQTQIFMETPYRNAALLKDVLEVLKSNTKLCIAANITLPDEFIFTQPVAGWKKQIPDLRKKPAIFLLLAD